MDDNATGKVITVEVPLSEMFGYATALRSNTQGRANFIMQFKEYDKCPKSVTEEVLKKRGMSE